jgi:hypothetical protein
MSAAADLHRVTIIQPTSAIRARSSKAVGLHPASGPFIPSAAAPRSSLGNGGQEVTSASTSRMPSHWLKARRCSLRRTPLPQRRRVLSGAPLHRRHPSPSGASLHGLETLSLPRSLLSRSQSACRPPFGTPPATMRRLGKKRRRSLTLEDDTTRRASAQTSTSSR